jgi:hypothetical protein
MTHSIKIFCDDQPIGELMTASNQDILAYLEKGMRVVDQQSGEEYTKESVTSAIGVSDGEIILE